MKKNILRVVSLLLVATMLFAFCSCTQKVEVRFVDKDGNDINIGALTGSNGNSAGSNDETTPPDNNDTPTEPPTTDAPATDAPSSDGSDTPPATDAPTNAPSNDTPATEAPTTKAPGNAAPTGKENVFNFYKTAVAKVKGGAAGYIKKEWQTISNLNLAGVSTIDNLIASLAGNYMTKEDKAEDQVCEKGSQRAKDRFPACTLTDMSKVKSATCAVQSNGNYKVTIIMADENTPKKSGNFLGKVTNSILYWEDIETELKKIKQIKEYDKIQVIYKGYKIEAELTPDGNFVSMKHLGSVDIKIGHVKILFLPLDNKSAHLDNFCTYTKFKY